MTTSTFIDMPATRANLNRAIAHSAPHLRPVLEAVRDFQIGMLFVRQTPEPFRLPRDRKRPMIIMIGDDFDRAVGPTGFHMPSVRRAIRACRSFVVVSSSPTTDSYSTVAQVASVTRTNAMLVETQIDQEITWLGLIQKLAPGKPIRLSTVEGGNA